MSGFWSCESLAPFSNGGLVVIFYFTTVGFIDIELVAYILVSMTAQDFPFHDIISGYLSQSNCSVYIFFGALKTILLTFLHMLSSVVVISYH